MSEFFEKHKSKRDSTLNTMLRSDCSGNAESADSLDTPEAVLDYLAAKNAGYVSSGKNNGNISSERRSNTAENGQNPYAVIITCSDSRVPPEHIFSAGIGELFVIRTAGNVIGDYELGSVEYGAEHLHSKVVLVLGHTGCGAVDAAINGGAHGYIKTITDEISACLTKGCTPREAEIRNVENSIRRLEQSKILRELKERGEVLIQGAIYDISTGTVEHLG